MLRVLLVLALMSGGGAEASGRGAFRVTKDGISAAVGKARNFLLRTDGKPSGLQKAIAGVSAATVICGSSLVCVKPAEPSYGGYLFMFRVAAYFLDALAEQRRAYYEAPQEEQSGNLADQLFAEPGDKIYTAFDGVDQVVIEKKNEHGETTYTNGFGEVIGIDATIAPRVKAELANAEHILNLILVEVAKFVAKDGKAYDPEYRTALANATQLHTELSTIYTRKLSGRIDALDSSFIGLGLLMIGVELDIRNKFEGFIRNDMGWLGHRMGLKSRRVPKGELELGLHYDDRHRYHARKAEFTAMDYEGVYVHWRDNNGRSEMGKVVPSYHGADQVEIKSYHGVDTVISLAQISGVFILWGDGGRREVFFSNSDMQPLSEHPNLIVPEAQEVDMWRGRTETLFSDGYIFVTVNALRNRGESDFQELATPFLAIVNGGSPLADTPSQQ